MWGSTNNQMLNENRQRCVCGTMHIHTHAHMHTHMQHARTHTHTPTTGRQFTPSLGSGRVSGALCPSEQRAGGQALTTSDGTRTPGFLGVCARSPSELRVCSEDRPAGRQGARLAGPAEAPTGWVTRSEVPWSCTSRRQDKPSLLHKYNVLKMLTEQVWPCIRVHQRTQPFPHALWKEILAPHRCSVCDTLPHAQLVLGTAHGASVLLPPAAGCCPGSRRLSAPDARRSPPTRHNAQRKSRARAGARPGRLHSASQETRGSFSRPPLRSCWPWTCPGCGDPAGGLFWGSLPRVPPGSDLAPLRASRLPGSIRELSQAAPRGRGLSVIRSPRGLRTKVWGEGCSPWPSGLRPRARMRVPVLRAHVRPALSTGPPLRRPRPRLARSPFLFPGSVCLHQRWLNCPFLEGPLRPALPGSPAHTRLRD